MSQSALWSGLALVNGLRARLIGAVPQGVSGVSIDTRTLNKGDLYVAIKGETNDGHDFVAKAFEKGAGAAVIDEAHADALKGLGSLYVVEDTLSALESLGRAARERTQARITAITGSVGKTSTKEALRLVLESVGHTHASVASYNNHWGVPLTLARMPAQTDFGIFEIGMNHAGEITPLTKMVRPHIAIITTIAPVHLEAFDSIDGIADAKAEIFSGLEPGGMAIVHRDIAQYERIAIQAGATHMLSFGESEEADARLLSTSSRSEGQDITAQILGRQLTYHLGAPGRHMAINSLSILLAAHSLGLDLATAAQALAYFKPPTGRGARFELPIPNGTLTLIDESYNANPASMRAALTLLGDMNVKGRRIAILGDMLELGPQSADLHQGLIDSILANKIDLVFASGPMMKHLYDALPASLKGEWVAEAQALVSVLTKTVKAGDALMIKGSNGSRMGPVVAKLKEIFTPEQTIAD